MSIIRKTVSLDLLANACEKQKKEAVLLILLTTSLRFSTAPGGIRTHGLSLRSKSHLNFRTLVCVPLSSRKPDYKRVF